MEFMNDGGYQRPDVWLSLGWSEVQKNTLKEQDWEKFDKPLYWFKENGDHSIYSHSEALLLLAAKGHPFEISAEFEIVTKFFEEDFKPLLLITQLQLLACSFSEGKAPEELNKISFQDVLDHLRTLSQDQRMLLSEVVKLTELLVVMPATNATSERSFSSLRRLKTYLRSRMGQERMNHLLVLQTHSERVSKLDLRAIANDFVSKSERRLTKFGKL